MRILLLESDRSYAKIVKESLETDGHAIIWRSSADNALSVLDTSRVDAIIAEIQVAKHNGIEFLYEIRSYPDLAMIPVIILTMIPEIDMPISNGVRKQLGIARYLYKPSTSLRNLIMTVNQLA